MFSVSIILLAVLIPSVQSSKPSLKLTFTPEMQFYDMGTQVEISCELINPTDQSETSQLWHVDLKTGKHTPISRALLVRPTEDVLDVYKTNKEQRVQYVKKNHLRIRQILIEDVARYECNCPDCEESLGKRSKDFQVMKLSDPRWHVEPGWPIQERAKTTIKCTAEDFYPYAGHQIFRNHHDITNEGKAVLPAGNTYPQKFSWEATVTPSADWHNETIRCALKIGSHEKDVKKMLDVIFTPRFLTCEPKQHVNFTKEKSTIQCTYAGNPKPTLTWLRQSDEKPLASDLGITVSDVDEHHGKYKSIVTFERDKLINIPLTTTTRAPNAPPETTPQSKVPAADSYYQQLLNGGVIVRLSHNNEVKDSRTINIVSDANQARASLLGNSASRVRESLSTSTLLLVFCSLSILRYMIQLH